MPDDVQSPLPRLAVMISGGGRTLVNLLEACRDGRLAAQVALVVASREGAGAVKARTLGLRTAVVPGAISQAELEKLLAAACIDWVVLAGYLHLVEIPGGWKSRVVNIHPALLPKFGGRGMYGRRVHEAVLAAKESVSGCTVHMADGEYDKGRIILQRECPVRTDDTPETLGQRVFELECEAYPTALQQLIQGEP